ncbi:unnamed protein product [Leptidea sinapis]|uniref:BTB domain-containing protein n=1 Tax=Leptidea sinapis TaxID=189913 RepID=A0A5E4QUX3_9NEOP|nr:unnamed protein product [Leptidea sinapis]
MNNAPQFSLRWNNYVSHVTGAFNILRFEHELVDVTLCCDGGKIKAHKMLLSACSNYFKQIFKENPCNHPVIIFRNFKYEDLNAIVNFMYHGEVNIFQEQLESFLNTAELLEVKGLTDNLEDESYKSLLKFGENSSLDLSSKQKIDNVEPHQTTLDEPINLATLQTSREENVVNDSSTSVQEQDSDIFEVQLDESRDTKSDLAKFRCQLCPKGFKHPTSLTLHKDSHAGKTQCPVCHRSFSRSYDMRSHLQRIHQGKQLTIKEIRYKNSNDSTVAAKPYTHNM